MVKNSMDSQMRAGPAHSQHSERKTKKPFCCLYAEVFLLYFVAYLCCLSNSVAAASCRELHRDSLLSLSITISNPSSPLNWSSEVDCCIWEGVACDGNGQVRKLWLPHRGLQGIIPPSIFIKTLTHINLTKNSLRGHLPDGFFTSLNQLQVIDLSNNQLSGELLSSERLPLSIHTVDLSSNQFDGGFPSSFNKLALNLTDFSIRNNSFTGEIPSSICHNSPFIIYLYLSSNKFQSAIPQGFGRCQTLEVLRLGFNFLSGKIPSDIYSIGSLIELSLPSNKLVGSVKDAISNTSNLEILELYGNELGGAIPKNIGKLSNLERLLLQSNNLASTLPSSLMNCTKLKAINLRSNNFSGKLSSLDFSNLSQLIIVDLGDNNFTGSLPESLFSCKTLIGIRLDRNLLEGEISPSIAALQSLSFLSLSRNRLTNFKGAIRSLMGCKKLSTIILSLNFDNETIPDDITVVDSKVCGNLRVLGLGGCQFNGKIPDWLANCRTLEVIDLSFNQLKGSIPSWLATLPKLFYLDLSYNNLGGNFPKELTRIHRLTSEQDDDRVNPTHLEMPVFVQSNNLSDQEYKRLRSLPPAIYLRQNSLTGKIPIEIGQMKLLHSLDLSMNNFVGQIPHEMSNLTNLEKLDLSGNKLSGTIPPSLKSLHFLSAFNVSNNNLSGSVPSGGQFDTFLPSSFEGNSGLCLRLTCTTLPESKHETESQTGFIPQHFGSNFTFGLVLGMGFSSGFTLTILTRWILTRKRLLPKCLLLLSPFSTL